MKKIVYLGYIIPPEEANRISGASVAGNKMQWSVVKNLALIDDIQITCVVVTPMAAYPHDKKIYQKYEKEKLFPGVISHRVAYCNLPMIKQIWQIVNVYRIAKKVIEETGGDTLFCFNLFPQIGVPMRWLKKKFSRLDTVCLLADLPIDDNTNRKGFSAFLRKFFEKSTWKSMRLCEKYIVLNKHVIDKYLPDKPYIVVDGGVDEVDIKRYEEPIQKNGKHNVLFCGALTEYNGILNLIDAMEYLQDTDIVLDIYGGGCLEDYVTEASKKNPKIRYHGRVSNQEVMKKQREAWLLINPRIVDDPIAQVTFPSKIFEYLLSGTPILSTRLNGYGEEYDDVMFFAEDDSSLSLANAIQIVSHLSKNTLLKTSLKAKEFIENKRNWKTQCKRIFDFLLIRR